MKTGIIVAASNLGASPQLECWNDGTLETRPEGVGLSTAERVQRIRGFGELKEWVTCRETQSRAIGKIKLKNHKRNEKFRSNPFGRRRIYIIPLFHHSIIPYVRQDYQASVNVYNFSALAG